MFEKKLKSSTDFSGKISRIAEGTVIRGEIVSDSDLRLDGELIGNFNSNGKIIIGKEGKLNGDVICVNADIEGQFDGKIIVNEGLNIKSSAFITGEITYGRIAVENGAILNISCLMQKSDARNEINSD